MPVRLFDVNSNIIRFILKRSDTGQGLTGLTEASAGLIISTICDIEATPTVYTQAATHIETIAALGTFQAPSASCCRFKEVDATNHKGLYEFQFADARFGVANAHSLVISVTGAALLLDTDYEIELVRYDPFDGTRLGLTSIPVALVGGRIDASVGAMANNVLTDAAINADAITNAKIADDAIAAENLKTGALTADAFAAGAIPEGAFAAGAINAAAIKDAAIDFATFAADCKTGTGLKANVESMSANTVTAAAIATDAIDMDALAADAVAELQSGLATAADIENQILDALTADHTDVGSIGKAITDAGAGGDPDVFAAAFAAHADVIALFTAAIASVKGAGAPDIAAAITAVSQAIASIKGAGTPDIATVVADIAAALATIQGAGTPDIAAVVALLPAALVGGRIDANIGSKTVGLALTAQEKADVNAEVLDTLATDTYAEPVQGNPAATASLATKIGHIYKNWRNKKTGDGTTEKYYNDDGVTVDHKRTTSEAAGTVTVGEVATGP